MDNCISDVCIKREVAAFYIGILAGQDGNNDLRFALSWAARKVREIPAADVHENVHGEWIYRNDTDTFQCSVCGDAMARDTYLYCPWCGVDMRKRKEV